MRRMIFATTALTSMLAFGALAQEATDPAADPAATPEVMPADPATPAVPGVEAATDETMPADPATDTAEEVNPDASQGLDTAQDPAAPAMTPDTTTAQDPATGAAPMDTVGEAPVLNPVETADISADRLIGAQIQTMDGENIAAVEDVLMSDDGAVENIVAQFGGFLGFGSNTVLLTMDEIEVMEDESGTLVVQTALTPESLEGRPEYQEDN